MATESVVGKRLHDARLRADLSQKQLGIRAGIDEFSASPRINQYERGKHAPSFNVVQKLAAVLDVPVAYFYCDDDELADLLVAYSSASKVARKRALRALRPD